MQAEYLQVALGMLTAAARYMAKTSSNLDTPLSGEVDRLAAFEPQDLPVASLYLNLAPGPLGRDEYEAFCRKAFADQLKSFAEGSAARASLERDMERIQADLESDAHESSNALAIFATSTCTISRRLGACHCHRPTAASFRRIRHTGRATARLRFRI